ncbi:ATP-binding protein [Streptomyces sp. NPDC002755]|uniref:ATP-binding protein n=1 Tax=Streptomyces sp. NPDC002884 TaxID=3154544 RepID=UPI00331AC823
MTDRATVAVSADRSSGFDSGGSGPRAASPIGQEAELGRILECAERGRAQPQSLLVLGEAGTGKTELLRIAMERTSTHVLAAQGCETEMQQSFAAPHQVLLPVLGDLAFLPERQRDALRAAFGLAPTTGPTEPMVFRVAFLMLLRRVARVSPLLLAVDDIQACDRDSLGVLLLAARRLADESVTVLLAARGEVPRWTSPQISRCCRSGSGIHSNRADRGFVYGSCPSARDVHGGNLCPLSSPQHRCPLPTGRSGGIKRFPAPSCRWT